MAGVIFLLIVLVAIFLGTGLAELTNYRGSNITGIICCAIGICCIVGIFIYCNYNETISNENYQKALQNKQCSEVVTLVTGISKTESEVKIQTKDGTMYIDNKYSEFKDVDTLKLNDKVVIKYVKGTGENKNVIINLEMK